MNFDFNLGDNRARGKWVSGNKVCGLKRKADLKSHKKNFTLRTIMACHFVTDLHRLPLATKKLGQYLRNHMF